jgi:hypothetical protein
MADSSLHDLASKAPKSFWSSYPNGAIIDEAQNCPDIFPQLQIMVDEDRFNSTSTPRRFILTGSSSLDLLQDVSQSLTGRTAILNLLPLSVAEIESHFGHVDTDNLILSGGYPAIWLSPSDSRHLIISNYYTTFIERDARRLVNIEDLVAFQSFIRLCASHIGKELNISSLAIEVGVTTTTIKHWLSLLSASFILYLLPPYHSNIDKRLTKAPKVYFYDTAVAAFLLGIDSTSELVSHPLRGALFENLVINEFIKQDTNAGKNRHFFFYTDKSQREIDLLISSPLGLEAYEIKAAKSMKPSFFSTIDYLSDSLSFSRLSVIYDGSAERTSAIHVSLNFRHLNLLSSPL